eukprot:365252-Chlamydomonas_euryale.AAC.29
MLKHTVSACCSRGATGASSMLRSEVSIIGDRALSPPVALWMIHCAPSPHLQLVPLISRAALLPSTARGRCNNTMIRVFCQSSGRQLSAVSSTYRGFRSVRGTCTRALVECHNGPHNIRPKSVHSVVLRADVRSSCAGTDLCCPPPAHGRVQSAFPPGALLAACACTESSLACKKDCSHCTRKPPRGREGRPTRQRRRVSQRLE